MPMLDCVCERCGRLDVAVGCKGMSSSSCACGGGGMYCWWGTGGRGMYGGCPGNTARAAAWPNGAGRTTFRGRGGPRKGRFWSQ